jgi:hypothetical protein
VAGPLVAWLAVSACSDPGDPRSPEGAVRMLITAARRGDRVSVYRLLGPETRARVDALAASTRRTSGRVPMKPEDLLSVGWAPPAWDPAGMRTLRRDGDRADVEVYSGAGDRHPVTLVRQNGEWKVELPGR